jgi:chitinase
MTYDFHGTWNERVGVNAPLFDQKDSEMMSVHGCVENWVNGGAPREKINIGFPFYGRSFLGAKALYEEFGGAADESMWHEDEGCPQYYNIIRKFKGLTSFRDETTMTQVAYSKSGVLSYDDPRAICDKTEYAMNEALNG